MHKLVIKERYGVVPNHILTNKDLSFRAKGLFAYIQSKPDGWQFSAERIAIESREGKNSILAGLNELKDHGFLRRKQTKDEKGQWIWEYLLYSQPSEVYPEVENPQVENPQVENPQVENPAMENPAMENRAINKERYTKKEIKRKNINKYNKYIASEQGSQDLIVKEENRQIIEVIDEFKKWNPASVRWYANKTQREAVKSLIRAFGIKKVLSAVQALPTINKQKYARKSTTPIQLLENWAIYSTIKEQNDDIINPMVTI